jgi:deoxyribodipyrimidine photo-lyase
MNNQDEKIQTLMWFRRDLRLKDNPAYHHAVRQGGVIAVYTLNEGQWDKHNVAPMQRSLVIDQLRALEVALSKDGIPLIVINTNNFKAVSKALLAFAKKTHCTHINFNEEYELNERTLTDSVNRLAQKNHIKIQSFHDQCLIEPGKILNKQGNPYKVFSAFKKAYLSELNSQMRPILPLPKVHLEQTQVIQKSDLSALLLTEKSSIKRKSVSPDFLILGESQAHEHLNEFCIDRIINYKQDRDCPAIHGTSQLSASLAIGLLSVRQCFQAAQQYNASNNIENEGISTWISELIWRDFYRHLLFLFPELCKHKPFKEKTDELPWKHDTQLFNAWINGKTGYPLVDAAMRQLKETGWMHNRLRMVTAMFLTKHLFIDWRWGEKYFFETLIDADFASNNGGWQWSASTGVDAAPYFRIFNPTRQSERFDSEGAFIRQYVPELASLDNKSIHSPKPDQINALGYVHPIVDHASSVKQTKVWFKSLDATAVNQMQLPCV